MGHQIAGALPPPPTNPTPCQIGIAGTRRLGVLLWRPQPTVSDCISSAAIAIISGRRTRHQPRPNDNVRAVVRFRVPVCSVGFKFSQAAISCKAISLFFCQTVLSNMLLYVSTVHPRS